MFNPDSLAPPLILYEVCGEAGSSVCDSLQQVCDTIHAYVIPDIVTTISPFPPVFCADSIQDITANVPIYNIQLVGILDMMEQVQKFTMITSTLRRFQGLIRLL